MFTGKQNLIALTAAAAMLSSATLASADHRNRGRDHRGRQDNRSPSWRDDGRRDWNRDHNRRVERSRADVDIDELSAELRVLRIHPEITACYEVEIEDARPGETFTLELRLHVRGRTLRDVTGRPMAISIPLRIQSHCADEVKFKDRIKLRLKPLATCDLRDVRIEARVISNCDGRIMDCADRSVCLKR